MKTGVIFFHKNINKIYKKEWVDKSIRSMLNQSYSDFEIYELNYGESEESIISEYNPKQKHNFFSLDLKNHGHAMNYILDKAFSDGCDYVFNTNLDDYYSRFRIQMQLNFFSDGVDVVSSNFYHITEIEGVDSIVRSLYVSQYQDSIEKELIEKSHNVIAHPVVAFSKKFWEKYRYDPEEIPEEDLKLWQRACLGGSKFKILEDFLLHYRLHGNQITGNNLDLCKNTNQTVNTQISEIPSSDPTRLP
jgi:hypothetical protein